MREAIPFFLGIVLGALVNSPAVSARVRAILNVASVLAAGLVATVLSGEYLESWAFLLLDVGEAAVGLAVGMLIARWHQRPGAGPSAQTEQRP